MTWFGELPPSWRKERNIGVFEERKEVGFPKESLLSVTIEKGVIPQEEILTKKDSSNEDKSKYKLVKPGDLAYNKMRMWQGAIGKSEHQGIVSPAYIILRPRDKRYSKYFHYLYRTQSFINEANRNSYGLCLDMNSLRYEDFKTIYSPVPPVEEMDRIVAFLDQKTAEVDEAIAKKQRLIELLNEQKAILINRAVTKGLDPSAPMKDSGVEWIGEMPFGWQVKKVKYCSKIYRGKFTHRPRNDPKLYDGTYPFVQTGDVARAKKYIKDYHQTLNEFGRRVTTMSPSGTILMTIAANIADVAILDFDACFPDSVVGFLPNKEISNEFLYYSLLSLGEQLRRAAIKSTQANLNLERIGANSITIPSSLEQKKIVDYIESVDKETYQIIGLISDEITKLKELRSTLIANAVLGKLSL